MTCSTFEILSRCNAWMVNIGSIIYMVALNPLNNFSFSHCRVGGLVMSVIDMERNTNRLLDGELVLTLFCLI
jgi:hypothetical protein